MSIAICGTCSQRVRRDDAFCRHCGEVFTWWALIKRLFSRRKKP